MHPTVELPTVYLLMCIRLSHFLKSFFKVLMGAPVLPIQLCPLSPKIVIEIFGTSILHVNFNFVQHHHQLLPAAVTSTSCSTVKQCMTKLWVPVLILDVEGRFYGIEVT